MERSGAGHGGQSRRDFLRTGGAAALVVASAAGCDFFSTGAQNGSGSTTGAKGKEAPMLARMVQQGNLPPVEERLPDNPLVVQPNSRMGVYGGTWNSATLGTGDWPWMGRTVGYENLTRWSVDWNQVIPNLAERYQYNSDATAIEFKLRSGLKWSDGEPYTTDDIVFAVQDIYRNPDVYPDAGSLPFSAEKVDDLTFRLVLDEPDATWVTHELFHFLLVNKPKHYLEQFHGDYNSDADQLANDEGFDSWVDLLDNKCGVVDWGLYWQNAEIPTMYAWRMVEPLSDGGRMVVERNPYYWKTDPDGSQLPYLDRVVFEVLEDEQVMLTRALNGDFNMHMRHFNNLQNKPVLANNRERGGYSFFDAQPSEMNTAIISLNLTIEDEVKREIFNNKDFRIGLSHAINRQEIIDVVYQQQGEPWQAAPRQETPFFNEMLAKQYTVYDVDRANQHLDRAGYSERNGDGIRLGPDGNPISFTVELVSDFRPDHPDAMELVVGYWQEVGIDASINAEERSLFYERKEANQPDATVWVGDNGLLDAIEDPRWYFPSHTGESNFAIPWARWWASDGEDGQEPPAAPKEQQRLYEELRATPEEQGRNEIMGQILQIAQEQFYVIGLNLTPPGYGIVGNNFHNVPGSIYDSSVYNNPGPTNPEQYYVQQG